MCQKYEGIDVFEIVFYDLIMYRKYATLHHRYSYLRAHSVTTSKIFACYAINLW